MRVFVTRPLAGDSPLKNQLEAAGHEVIGCSLLRFAPVELPSEPSVDWLFAYSPRGVDFYLRQAGVPGSVRLGAMGRGTAAAWERAGYRVDFVGEGQPTGVASAFAKRATGQRIGFPQAAQSRQTVERILGTTCECVPLVVYRNVVDPELAPPAADLYVLTSPLNARAALGRTPVPPAQLRLLAIGPSTAAEAAALGFGESPFPEHPTEEALAHLALELLRA